jgi:hypothetical protein
MPSLDGDRLCAKCALSKNLVFERDALRVVFLEPNLGRKDLQMILVANLLACRRKSRPS